MRLSINSDVVAAAIDSKIAEIRAAVERALDVGAQAGLQRKEAEIRTTYKRRIPRRSEYNRNRPRKGKYKLRKPDGPAWERKAENGGWSASQSIVRRPGERDILTSGEPVDYEERLANLPTGRDGVNRSNPAAERTHANFDRWGRPLIERELRRALR